MRKKSKALPREGTVAIYARFSSSKQREASIEDQLRVCRQWCAERGREVVAEYCDYAKTGRSADRPEFQRMISNAGEAETVLVYMMDRFSRDQYDAPYYKRKLAERGCRVVSATEAMPDGPESILIEKLYEGLAAVESAHIAQRTRRGMEGNALKCMHNGVRLFGYDLGEDGAYHVNEGEAEIVREMFSRRVRGESYGSIADDLAMRGVESTMHRPCSKAMVSAAIKNEKYIGVYKWGGTRVENGMPAIIDRDMFERARATRTKRRSSEDWTDYPLSGRAVCSGCGSPMVGVSGRNREGVKYTYYRCSKRCGVRPVRSDWLESTIVSELRRMLSSPERVRTLAERLAEGMTDATASERLEAAKKRRKDVRRGIENLMKAIERGLDFDDVKYRLDDLKEQERRADADIELWSGLVSIDASLFEEFLSQGLGMTDTELLEVFVWRVCVASDEVNVVLSLYEENKPIELGFSTGSHKIGWLPRLDSNQRHTD